MLLSQIDFGPCLCVWAGFWLVDVVYIYRLGWFCGGGSVCLKASSSNQRRYSAKLNRMVRKRREEKIYLPEDIMVDILSRLPVKSLLRFKSVCTHWRALISSPSFVSLHLNCSISNPTRHSIVVHIGYENNFIPFDPITCSPFSNLDVGSLGNSLKFVGSINGLVCIGGITGKWLCLWNPSTRLFKKLETGINRNWNSSSVGFGCDLTANDYKVVVIGVRRRKGVTRTEVKVWSANLESWKEIKVDCKFSLRKRVCDVMVKGFAYWIVRDGLESNGKNLVASFDMSNEVMRLVPVPECYPEHFCRFYGLIWNESFALAAFESEQIYQVWTIENDGVGKESWSKKFTIKLEFGFGFHPVNAGKGKLVCSSGNRMPIFYDLETQKMEVASTLKYDYSVSGAHYYVESLLSIKGFERQRLRENARKVKRPRMLY